MEASSASELFTVPQGREFGPFSEQRWRPEWSDGVSNMKGDGGLGPPPGFRTTNEVPGGVSSAFHFSRPDVNELFRNSSDRLGSLETLFDEKLILSSRSLPDQLDNDADELLGSIEDAIGNLLPNDEDELLADAGIHLGRASSLEDDFDIFNSGGGMELDGDSQNGYLNGLVGGNAATPAGEHPYGEHPSRTLFVRNINSNVEDMELRNQFEEYGNIRQLYTACKHRGFVMVSYYDIRAARAALRALNGKPLRRRKLDIHYSIPKDNPSDKDVNQGTLVVFNLDSSVSNEELRQKFGVYGEIKEIRETPHKKHHKFIEFYDVRAADAALRALNRSDIAGKRIKLEPSRPGGARRSLMQQLSHELEEEELRCQQMPSSLGSGQWSNKHNDSSVIRTGSPLSPSFNSFGGKPLNGLVGSLPARVSSPLRNSMTAAGHEPLLQQAHLSLRIRQQGSPLFPEVDSPTFSPSLSAFDGLEATHLQRTGLGDISGFEHSPRVLGASKNHNIWSNYHQMAGSPPVMYGDHTPSHFHGAHDFASNMHGPGADCNFVDGHNGYLPELSDKWPGSLALRLNGSNGSHLLATSHGGGFSKGVMIDSPRLGVMSPQHRPRSFPNGGILDGFNERGRSSPRTDTTATQYQLDLERIHRGEDLRTTLMIKNIPNKYTSKMLLATIDEHHRGTYDFIYLPIDFKNKCNVGYAFINMIEPTHIIPFYKTFNGKKWEKFNSEKVASLAYARIQGKAALVAHFQNSSLMNEDKRCRPILFHSEGPNLGDPEPFPVGSNVRTRPGRERNGLSHHYDSSSIISSSLSSCSSKEDENGELGQGSSDNENN